MELFDHLKIKSIVFLLITAFNLLTFLLIRLLDKPIVPIPILVWETFRIGRGYYGHFYNPAEHSGFLSTGLNPRHLIIKAPGTKDHKYM